MIYANANQTFAPGPLESRARRQWTNEIRFIQHLRVSHMLHFEMCTFVLLHFSCTHNVHYSSEKLFSLLKKKKNRLRSTLGPRNVDPWEYYRLKRILYGKSEFWRYRFSGRIPRKHFLFEFYFKTFSFIYYSNQDYKFSICLTINVSKDTWKLYNYLFSYIK